jgi:hypothetical protein
MVWQSASSHAVFMLSNLLSGLFNIEGIHMYLLAISRCGGPMLGLIFFKAFDINNHPLCKKEFKKSRLVV